MTKGFSFSIPSSLSINYSLNIANDMSVGLFLDKKINFLDIPKLVELCLEKHNYISRPTLEEIIGQIEWTQKFINTNLKDI